MQHLRNAQVCHRSMKRPTPQPRVIRATVDNRSMRADFSHFSREALFQVVLHVCTSPLVRTMLFSKLPKVRLPLVDEPDGGVRVRPHSPIPFLSTHLFRKT